eukprot:2191103-Amphidinium_carterae.4
MQRRATVSRIRLNEHMLSQQAQTETPCMPITKLQRIMRMLSSCVFSLATCLIHEELSAHERLTTQIQGAQLL